jgi:hypothetical protein
MKSELNSVLFVANNNFLYLAAFVVKASQNIYKII